MNEKKTIKCLVWDLDNTLWDGTLLEDGNVTLRPGVCDALAELDRRGILLSIASKNEYDDAMQKLRQFGLDEYFLAPQIGWSSKAESVSEIARLLNLGLDTFAFIDDQPAEREEVLFHNPAVRVYDAADYLSLPGLEEFSPRFVTEDSKLRRRMYAEDLKRAEQEERFEGSREDFLRTLNMRLALEPVKAGDLERAYELTVRTNQLNSTGATYSFDELTGFISSPDHVFLVASLDDKFGSYGKIGLVLAEKAEDTLTIKLLLMSCRVMTRGIGSVLLAYLINYSLDNDFELFADFVSTPRNRIMYITYKLTGFEEISREGDRCLLKYSGGRREYPAYLEFTAGE